MATERGWDSRQAEQYSETDGVGGDSSQSGHGVQVKARLTHLAIHQVKNGGLGRKECGLEDNQGD